MIFFVAPREGIWGITEYLEQAGPALCRRLIPVTYDEIVARRCLSLGTYIFAAIDELTPTQWEIAMQCCERLRAASPDLRIINRPTDVLLRHELLQRCFELKRNMFRARHASAFYRCRRFPVFVRPAKEHLGSLTPLLHSRGALVRALIKTVAAGHRFQDLLVVEFCDTADPSGIYRVYSAAIVADRIIPKTLIHNRAWVTKWQGRLLDADKAREQAEYVEGNLHTTWLKETFALSGIGYGRIDYGVANGVPQVWEINTNPTLVRRTGAPSTMSAEQWKVLAPAQAAFMKRFGEAFEAIDANVDPGRSIPIEVLPRQLYRLEREKRRRARLLDRRTAIGLLARIPRRLAGAIVE